MPETVERLIVASPDFTSSAIGSFFAQLDDQTRLLANDTRAMTPEELQWQPAPGNNTIGMLLAHLAVVEVFWVCTLMERAFLCEQVLGIGGDDDGMPLPEGAAPPQNLAGKTLSSYNDLLMKAREHTRLALVGLSDSDLTREIDQRGRTRATILNGRWILYHVAEHLSGHFGQILLLRHLYRSRPQG